MAGDACYNDGKLGIIPHKICEVFSAPLMRQYVRKRSTLDIRIRVYNVDCSRSFTRVQPFCHRRDMAKRVIRQLSSVQ